MRSWYAEPLAHDARPMYADKTVCDIDSGRLLDRTYHEARGQYIMSRTDLGLSPEGPFLSQRSWGRWRKLSRSSAPRTSDLHRSIVLRVDATPHSYAESYCFFSATGALDICCLFRLRHVPTHSQLCLCSNMRPLWIAR